MIVMSDSLLTLQVSCDCDVGFVANIAGVIVMCC